MPLNSINFAKLPCNFGSSVFDQRKWLKIRVNYNIWIWAIKDQISADRCWGRRRRSIQGIGRYRTMFLGSAVVNGVWLNIWGILLLSTSTKTRWGHARREEAINSIRRWLISYRLATHCNVAAIIRNYRKSIRLPPKLSTYSSPPSTNYSTKKQWRLSIIAKDRLHPKSRLNRKVLKSPIKMQKPKLSWQASIWISFQ